MNGENIAQDPLIIAWRNLQHVPPPIYESMISLPIPLISNAARFLMIAHNHVATVMSIPPEPQDTIH